MKQLHVQLVVFNDENRLGHLECPEPPISLNQWYHFPTVKDIDPIKDTPPRKPRPGTRTSLDTRIVNRYFIAMQRTGRAARGAMLRADAEVLGLRALQYLAETDALEPFCAESGIAQASLARHASEPDLLAAVLDFVMQDDSRLLGLCAAADTQPETVVSARRLLPGAPPDP
jgi:hypothetical protein